VCSIRNKNLTPRSTIAPSSTSPPTIPWTDDAPQLRERALEATRTLGVGSGSVRTIAGTMSVHMELERRLAEFKRTEATVVFQSGFTAKRGNRLVDPGQRGLHRVR
jgi:hypothetical protein